MATSLSRLCLLLGIALYGSVALAAPDRALFLLPLQKDDAPHELCTCRYYDPSESRQEPFLIWPMITRKTAYVRDANGLQKLFFRSESFIPQRRKSMQRGDYWTALFSNDQWRIQIVSEMGQQCTPKLKCTGAYYRSRLMMQKNNRSTENLELQAHCDC